MAELAQEALREQLRLIRRHEAGARRGRDIEALHDMRVAVRRSRAAVSLFRDVLDPRFRKMRGELEWLGDALGRVRDLDVLGQRIEKLAAEPPAVPIAELRPLQEALAEAHRLARSQLLADLDSDRYARAIEQFRLLLRSKSGSTDPAADGVRPLVEKRRDVFRTAAAALEPNASGKRRHRVRILAKQYRYAIEFTAEFLTAAEWKLPKRLAELQDALGAEQDAVVAIGRLKELAKSNPEAGAAASELALRFKRFAERESKGSDRLLAKLLG